MRTHHFYTIPCGLLLLAVCVLFRCQIGRRRFNRRGIGGLPQFSGYGKAITITFLERLVLCIANLCGWAGLFLFALAGFNHLKF
jgi:hypothetical protein